MAMFLKKHVFSPLFLDKTKHTFLLKLATAKNKLKLCAI